MNPTALVFEEASATRYMAGSMCMLRDDETAPSSKFTSRGRCSSGVAAQREAMLEIAMACKESSDR